MVAVKTLAHERHSLMEADILKELQGCPFVVKVQNQFSVSSYYSCPGFVVIEMEYVVSLESIFRLRRERRAPVDPKLQDSISFQLFSAMEHLHSKGVCHRDVKPSNVGVSQVGCVKLIDFGLFCKVQTGRSYTQEVVSLWWRAPEMFLWPEYTNPCALDVWAAAVVVVEVYSWECPFRASQESEVFLKVHRAISHPSEMDALLMTVPQWIKPALRSCLCDVEERWTAEEAVKSFPVGKMETVPLQGLLVPFYVSTTRKRSRQDEGETPSPPLCCTSQ